MADESTAVVLDADGREELRGRAARRLSETPRPFLRWAGSKQKLLDSLIDFLPDRVDRYVEPFFGGGALFFLLRPSNAVVSDAAHDLMHMYRAVRDGPAAILRQLSELRPTDKEQYYRVRSNRSSERYARAAEFIYLNRSCWNGLYRVNLKGEFNVPYGSPHTDFIVEPENIQECSKVLRGDSVKVLTGDFEVVLNSSGDGDFVFLDPPYVTGHNNNGFIDYNQKLFSWDDQVRLAKAVSRAADRGARILVTNAHHDAVLELYRDFNAHELERPSTLAGNSQARRKVTEAVITSY